MRWVSWSSIGRTRRRGSRRRAPSGTRSPPSPRRWPRATGCRPRSGAPAGSSAAGRTRSAGSGFRQLGPDRRDAEVGPEELVGRAEHDVEAELACSQPPVRREVDRRPGPASAPALWAAAAMRAASGIEADGVRGERERDHARALADQLLEGIHDRASCPRPGAARCAPPGRGPPPPRSHGDTFASWSSAVTTISSPGSIVRATACASWKFSVVMFAPKAMPSGSPPVKSAAAARPAPSPRPTRATCGTRRPGSSSSRAGSRSSRRSPRCGTWEPPGPSK